MNLATMDRDTLFALDNYELIALVNDNLTTSQFGASEFDREWYLLALDQLRIKLQQSAAEARHDTQNER